MKKRFLYTPIILIIIYLIITLCLFKWGAYSWEVKEPMFFWPLNFLYIVALTFGYIIGILLKLKNKYSEIQKDFMFNQNHLFFIIAIFALLCTYFETVRGLGLETLNPIAIIERSKTALENPAAWYTYTYSDSFKGNYGGKFFSIILLIMGPLLYAAIPLTVFWFKKLRGYNKLLGIIIIIAQTVKWIVSGKNKGLFDIVIYIGIVIIINIFRERLVRKRTSMKSIVACIALLLGGIFAIAKFGATIGARLGDNWINYQVGGYAVNPNSPLLMMVPDVYKGLLAYITIYLTQGYQALAMITDMRWIPLWGVGNSKFLVEYLSKYFDVDLTSMTYQYRLEEFGWGVDLNWHSLYLYIANDTGVIGVAVVLILLGLMLGITYYESLYQYSALSLLLLIQLCVVCLYIPANNIIFNHIGSFVTFYIIFFIWLLNKTTLFRKRKC